MNLIDPQVYLAPLDEDCLEQVLAWKSDVQLARQLVAVETTMTIQDVHDWYKRTVLDAQQVLFGVFQVGSNNFIGIARLMFIDALHKTAELGIYLGNAEMRGHGLGRETVKHLIDYAFNRLKLERLYLRVLATNTAALRCYTACGFQLEGTWREHVVVDGKRCDMVLMGLLQREFVAEAS